MKTMRKWKRKEEDEEIEGKKLSVGVSHFAYNGPAIKLLKSYHEY